MVLIVATLLASRTCAADEGLSYNRDIRPILAANCFQCHGPDAKNREADLRLDTREGATGAAGGPAAIVPEDPDDSPLMERIAASDDDLRMPPPETGKRLTPQQIERLRSWIASGAPYEAHWAFLPVKRPALPAVQDIAWAKNGIDRFVLSSLEQHLVAPSPTADRTTLIRRLYLDLVGLLPTPSEVDAFVADPRPDACDRLVGTLLASPHFGERWGRHWLDQARYADSNGYAPDGERTMWPYRDWVIRAVNSDLPFDEFTIEQLAGDLLPNPTLDQLVATGFHRNTLINTEGGTKADQFRVEQAKDRVDTTGLVWMALTVGCANCHDHKYDPIKQKEYYELYAFFDSTQDQNSTSPTVGVPTATQREQLEQLDRDIAEVREQLGQSDAELEQRRSAWERQLLQSAENLAAPAEWTSLEMEAQSKEGATFQRLKDGSLLVAGENRAGDRYTLTAEVPINSIRSLRLEVLTHDSLPSRGPGRASNGNFVLSALELFAPESPRSAQPPAAPATSPRKQKFREAWADHSQPKYSVAGAIDDDPMSGWAVNGAPEGGPNHNRVAEFVLEQSLQLETGQRLTLTMDFHNGDSPYNLGRFRWSVSPGLSDRTEANAELRELAGIIAELPAKRTPQQRARLDEAFDRADPVRGPLRKRLSSLESQKKQLEKSIPATMVLRELSEPRDTHVHVRGDFLRPGDPVQPGVPTALPPMDTGPRRFTRLDLARWLVRRDHPLTARVYVNRVWMRLFGRGLVETENDFGTQGALPTHPELLDWLSDDFVRGGWSTKRLIGTIVTSATYQQASHHQTDLAETDPRNMLLARQNRLRVEAEIVRDMGLVASGLLCANVGGPSVFPPQPDGVYAFTQTNKNWRVSTGEDRYRRGLYTFFYRSAPHPLLSTFDVPKFNQACTRRDRSDTPLQSLTVANEESLFEMTQALTRRVLLEAPDDASRLVHLYRLCLSREPLPEEQRFLLDFLDAQRRDFAGRPDAAAAVVARANMPHNVAPPDAAAWTAVARVVLNLDEFISRE